MDGIKQGIDAFRSHTTHHERTGAPAGLSLYQKQQWMWILLLPNPNALITSFTSTPKGAVVRGQRHFCRWMDGRIDQQRMLMFLCYNTKLAPQMFIEIDATRDGDVIYTSTTKANFAYR
jgi:hypothetical protein